MDEITLLYVEDSRTAQKILEKVISPIAECHFACSIAAARQMVARQHFTFFVLDYELPDGTGVDFAAELRQAEQYAQTPMLLYCSSLNNEMAYQAMKVGINESIAKPMNMLELRERIVKLIEMPVVKRVRRELLQLTCFSWQADGQYHEYSPDLNRRLSGDDQQEVRRQMQSILETEIRAKSDPSAYPADIHTFKHVVRLNPEDNQQAASEAA